MPSFITAEVAAKVLLVGKSINFMRKCCREACLDSDTHVQHRNLEVCMFMCVIMCVCICMYVCIYVGKRKRCREACLESDTHVQHRNLEVCMFMCVIMCVCIGAERRVWIRMYSTEILEVCVFMCVIMCVCMCMYEYMYAHVCMYAQVLQEAWYTCTAPKF